MAEPRKIFSVRALNGIKKVAENLTRDDSLKVTVKYRKFNETTSFNPENQNIASAYTDYATVDALKGHFGDKEVFLSGGMLELGDVRFMVWKSLVGGTPRSKDVLVENPVLSGVTYNVVDIWTDPLDLSYVFQCREV